MPQFSGKLKSYRVERICGNEQSCASYMATTTAFYPHTNTNFLYDLYCQSN